MNLNLEEVENKRANMNNVLLSNGEMLSKDILLNTNQERLSDLLN